MSRTERGGFDRRTVLRWMGIQLALPLVSSVIPGTANAQSAVSRKRFIGVFGPNGAYMPGGSNGAWNWNESLEPLVSAGLQNNAMIIRGLHTGNGADPHWQNTAGFLSCRPIVLGDPGVARCGKTVDQYVADKYPSTLRTLEVGAPYYHVHPLADHPGYSHDYLNRISWQTEDKFRSPISDPKQMFQKLFAVDSGSAAQIKYLHDRKMSVLDNVHKDATRLATRLPSAYRPVLSSYMESVREVETQLTASQVKTCTATMAAPTGDFSDPQTQHVLRYQLFNQMVVLALQCRTVSAATFMYGPSSSDIRFKETVGDGAAHHGCAHNRGDAGLINRVKAMTRVHMTLLADLVGKLNTAGILSDTLVLYGSDMSDGDAHLQTNLPVLLCGAGADLKFGQEVGSVGTPRKLADLHVDILQLLGLTNMTSFGSENMASTGQPIPIRA